MTETTLTVKVSRAAQLLACDLNGFSDPYVKLYLEPDPSKETKKKTKVVKKTLSPVWNEVFTYAINPQMMDRRLHVRLFIATLSLSSRNATSSRTWDIFHAQSGRHDFETALEPVSNP